MLRAMPTRRLRWTVGAACALAFAASTDGAAAVPDRATALLSYAAVLQDQRVDAGWTGATRGCETGSESPASLAATLRTVNVLRAFAGVGPVTFDAQFNQNALSAAVMMRAANRLSHGPGPDWPCYSAAGADGASHSNLFLGRSAAGAMVGYVDDSGVDTLGHRRWLLNPAAVVFGSGSTGTTNALYVVAPSDAPVAPNAAVAWPPPGWVPWPWIFADWSLALGAPGQVVDFVDPRVAVTIDGVAAAVRGVRQLGGGFGSGATLTWKVRVDPRSTTGDHTIAVAVSGAVVDGQPMPVTWAVSAFAPEPRFTAAVRILRPHGRRSAVRAGQRLGVTVRVTGAAQTHYQWLRAGRAIRGATRSTFRVRRRDRGDLVAVRVSASATAIGPSTERTSRPVRVRR